MKKFCNFIKKKIVAQVFSCEFCEISKNTFTYRTPLEKVFLEILQNSQENTCASLFFNKVAGLGLQLY